MELGLLGLAYHAPPLDKHHQVPHRFNKLLSREQTDQLWDQLWDQL